MLNLHNFLLRSRSSWIVVVFEASSSLFRVASTSLPGDISVNMMMCVLCMCDCVCVFGSVRVSIESFFKPNSCVSLQGNVKSLMLEVNILFWITLKFVDILQFHMNNNLKKSP